MSIVGTLLIVGTAYSYCAEAPGYRPGLLCSCAWSSPQLIARLTNFPKNLPHDTTNDFIKRSVAQTLMTVAM
jgi:hypothetical protein